MKMDIYGDYAVYVGTVRGAVAYTRCTMEDKIQFKLDDIEHSEVTSFEWDDIESEIVMGHKNGVVKFYNTFDNLFTTTISNLEGKGAVVGIGNLEQSFIFGRRSGVINLWSKSNLDSFSLNLQEESTMECCVQNPTTKTIVGTGGEKNDFKLWDVEKKTNIFKAKSLGHDQLNLPIPTSVRGISFFNNEDNLASCVTKEGHVLLYDKRAQRRPVSKFVEPKASYTTIAQALKDRQCVVGTTKGYIQLLDLRLPTKCVRTYKSFTGSVTSLVCEPTEQIVISTSLDRYLRIHNLETKECVFKKYMKQSLSKVLLKHIFKQEPKVEEGEKVGDTECDEIFKSMETIEEPPLKKKKKKHLDVNVDK